MEIYYPSIQSVFLYFIDFCSFRFLIFLSAPCMISEFSQFVYDRKYLHRRHYSSDECIKVLNDPSASCKFSCRLCKLHGKGDVKFRSRSEAVRHLFTRAHKEDRIDLTDSDQKYPWHCNFCKNNFPRRQAAEKHYEIFHDLIHTFEECFDKS